MSGSTLPVTGLVMTAPGRAELRGFDLPLDPAAQVVVRVELCGVCTPEQRVFRGVRATYPYWGGHELSAVVEDAGPHASDGILPGARVAVALMPRCGRCPACRSGLDNHCAYLHPPPAGSLPPGPRGFSDRMAVPPAMLFPVGVDLLPEVAALVEPVACVGRSLRLAAPQPGEWAVVHGAGTMGLLHVALLARQGCRVLAVCDDGAEAGRARAAGAIAAIPPDTLAERLAVETGGWGADLAFCTRGGVAAIRHAIDTAARGGRVVLYQSLGADRSGPIDMNDLHYREIRLIGTIAQTAADIAQAVRRLQADPGITAALAVETLPARDGQAALARATAPEVNRVLIDFRD